MRPATGGPAFPRPASEFTASGTLDDGNDAIREQGGMYLRQWYAGQALAGLLARVETPDSQMAYRAVVAVHRDIAETAFAIADAMIRWEMEGK
jgi:hypothetical protein